MRTHVSFTHPAEFVDAEGNEGILGIGGVQWFTDLLLRVPSLHLTDDLLQEDWGVVIYASRDQAKFWIGLSFFSMNEWMAHFHHDRLFQKFSKAGNSALQRLIIDFYEILAHDPSVSKITWYKQTSRGIDRASGSAAPAEG